MTTAFEQSEFSRLVELALDEAKRQGADQAEAGISGSDGLSVTVRLGEVETIEKDRSQSMGITVYKDGAKGSASSTDLSEAAIKAAVDSACSIARFTQPDDCAGLADAELMAHDFPDLDLFHPWALDAEQGIRLAQQCEAAARDFDPRISNSEGATVNSHQGMSVYGNSHGFLGGYPSTRHSLSCSVLASEGEDMQRDYWYSVSRLQEELDTPEAVGEEAARRTVERLNPQKLKTRQAPVLFVPEMARSLLGHLVGAIRGGALYRRASFLLDQKGEQLFPDFVQISELPLLPRALGSTPYDYEGVATCNRELVRDGVLLDYVLDSYSARKLGMQTTGNAGGVRNLELQPGSQSFDELVCSMDTGLILTELMGSGVNGVTGDYSRGAAGFWVEGGEIQYPVAEITIAGNLKQMFRQVAAVGSDIRYDSNTRTGSILVEGMTIAGG